MKFLKAQKTGGPKSLSFEAASLLIRSKWRLGGRFPRATLLLPREPHSRYLSLLLFSLESPPVARSNPINARVNIKKIARSFKSTTTEIQTKEGDFFAQTATYQPYTMNQLVLPIDFSDLIPENHVARVVIDMGEPLNDQLLDEVSKGGGRPAYHPKMMTKILL